MSSSVFKKSIYCAFILYVCGNCTAGESQSEIPEHILNIDNLVVFSPDSSPAKRIEFVQEERFGSSSDVDFGAMGDFAVDQNGRVFIADRQLNKIHVYHSDGRYFTQVGREGSGPGEFRVIGRVNVIENELFVDDPSQLSFQVYSLDDFEFSHTVNLNRHLNQRENLPGSRPGIRFVKNDEKLMAQFSPPIFSDPGHPNFNLDEQRNSEFYFMDVEGNIISDRVLTQRGDEFLITDLNEFCCGSNFQFLGRSLLAISNEGTMYSDWSQKFLIDVYNSEGEKLRSLFTSHPRVGLTLEDAVNSESMDVRRNMIQHADLPETWPAMNSMVTDDENRLWISTFTDETDLLEWWVLQDTGELIATFTWPNERSIEEIKNDFVYTREVDSMGVPAIVKYRMVLEDIQEVAQSTR